MAHPGAISRCKSVKWLFLAVLLISFRGHEGATPATPSEDREVKIGVLLPMTGYWPIGRTSASAITIAIERINNDSTLLPGYNMTFLWNDSMCLAAEGLNQAVEFQIAHVDAIIGDGCDIICEPAAILAASWNLPMISWGCESSKLSEKTLFPTFTRTVGSFSKMADLFLSVFSHFEWKNIGILASTQNIWQLAMASLVKTFQENDMNIRDLQSFSPGSLIVTEREEYVSMMSLAKESAQIFIILCYGGDMRALMLHALDLGMLNGDYAFLTVNLLPAAAIGNNTWMGNDGRDVEAGLAFRGILSIHVREPTSEQWGEFKNEVKKRTPKAPFNIKLADNEKVDVYAGTIYDAIYLYAVALNESLARGESKRDGRAIVGNMLNREFEGASGTVRIDESGDRDSDYSLKYYVNGSFQNVADYNHSTGGFNMRDVNIIWAGGRNSSPSDQPKCGWEYELCPEDEKQRARVINIVIGTSIAGVVVLTFLFWVIIRKLRYETDLAQDSTWKIKKQHLTIQNREPGTESTLHNEEESGVEEEQFYTTRGDYQSCTVAIKRLNKKNIRLCRKVLIELKQVRDLNHENLNPFIGACVESSDIMLIWSYCKKGSLQVQVVWTYSLGQNVEPLHVVRRLILHPFNVDVLEKYGCKIDNEVKMSMALDISLGMKYLHNSAIKYHGKLMSSKCVIDNHWVVKITDWGLHEFKSGQDKIDLSTTKKYRELLWTAPEHIDIIKVEQVGMSQKGDVYSYAIILQEILTSSKPFNDHNMEPREIIERVVAIEDPAFRPNVDETDAYVVLISVMTDCWHDDPEERPEFCRIVERLRKDVGSGPNIVENVVSMMEKHARYQEELVDERTRQLNEEKENTENLLYRLLPPAVVAKLKNSPSFPPQEFEEVTIFCCDIVGFTNMAFRSTPLEIVEFLNDLYVVFDELITRFDVHKIETVGDAYIVVSGCPTPNAEHAGHIASMALELLSSTTTFRIRHRPDHQLKLRIGIHTGPVVAGVVGAIMPRFCLFGHTVSIASRMESTSLPLRIQVSHESYTRLVELGGFYLEKRGQIKVKNGLVTTYWLVGKEGFEGSLPDPPPENYGILYNEIDIHYGN